MCFCLTLQLISSSAPYAINLHLNQYSALNTTHHDNLDEQVHTHTHKHSEQEDEHEHNHEHSKIVQNDIKTFCNSYEIVARLIIAETSSGFYEKYLFSDPLIFDIFRPPIA